MAVRKAAVIGATSWGTVLAVLLARREIDVRLWSWTEEEAETLRRERENASRHPDLKFPPSLIVTHDIAAALLDVDLAVLAVPSASLRDNLQCLLPHLDARTIILSAVKGLEAENGLRISEIVRQELGDALKRPACVLSGPNLSREIAQGLPAATIVACEDLSTGEAVRDVLMDSALRVYTNEDVTGVELAGALKNIIAIGAGMCDGFAYGDNAKAAFITRGLAEITRLGVAAGANALTFIGLAGAGDLIATCYSPLSRNHRVGVELAKGRSVDDVISSLGGQVAEGVATTRAARALARRLGVEMPITEKMFGVIFEGLDPRQGVVDLMGRAPKHELHGVR